MSPVPVPRPAHYTSKLANKSKSVAQQCKTCKIIKPKPEFKSLNTTTMLKNCQACQKAKTAILPPLAAGIKRAQKLAQKAAEEAKTQQDVTKQYTEKKTKRQSKMDCRKKKEATKAHLVAHHSSQM